jgi:hypothetical protein
MILITFPGIKQYYEAVDRSNYTGYQVNKKALSGGVPAAYVGSNKEP